MCARSVLAVSRLQELIKNDDDEEEIPVGEGKKGGEDDESSSKKRYYYYYLDLLFVEDDNYLQCTLARSLHHEVYKNLYFATSISFWRVCSSTTMIIITSTARPI